MGDNRRASPALDPAGRAARRAAEVVRQAGGSMRPFLRLCVRAGVLLVFYVLLERLVRQGAHLPQESYQRPFIVVELGKRLARHPLLMLAGLGLTGVWRHALWQDWSAWDHGQGLRRLVMLAAGTAAWAFSTYDYNLFFDQAHHLDRLLLIALAALVYWRPVFVLPLAVLLMAVGWQFDYPLVGRYLWTEMNLLLRALVLFGAAFLLQGLSRRRLTTDFVFLLCCLVASFYWGSGLGKLSTHWISHPYLHLLIYGAYANGWLAPAEPSTIVAISRGLAPFSLLLMLYALLVEWGCLFCLAHRAVLRACLAGFIVFHLGVFALTGMLFWKWIVLEAGLLMFLLGRRDGAPLPLCTRPRFVLSVLLIGGGILWFQPTNLTWRDTPLVYSYQMEAVGESGARYPLSARAMTPYADSFKLGPFFPALHNAPQLTGLWGISSNRERAAWLVGHPSPAEIFRREDDQGPTSPDPREAAAFDTLMRRFLGHWNVRRSKRGWWSLLRAPPHLWSIPAWQDAIAPEPVTRVIVYQTTTYYDGERLAELRRRIVHEVDVLHPGPRPGARR